MKPLYVYWDHKWTSLDKEISIDNDKELHSIAVDYLSRYAYSDSDGDWTESIVFYQNGTYRAMIGEFYGYNHEEDSGSLNCVYFDNDYGSFPYSPDRDWLIVSRYGYRWNEIFFKKVVDIHQNTYILSKH